MLLRESKLNDAAWDAIETRTKGPYDFERVSEKLRELERSAPSGKSKRLYRLHGMRHPVFT